MTIPFGMFDNVPDEDERKRQLMAKLLGPTRSAAVKRIGSIEYSPEEEANGLGLTKGEQQYRTARQVAEFVKEFTPMGDGEALGRVAEDVVKGRSRGWETAGDALSLIPVVGTLGDARRAGKAATKLDAASIKHGAGKKEPLSRAKVERDLASLVGTLRDMPWTDALKQAQKGEHLNYIPGEGYVGGPSTIKTPADLGAMRRRVDERVEAGAAGRDWYDRSRRDVRDVFPHDEGLQTRWAQNLGLYSASASPETNLGFSLNQHYAGLTGDRKLNIRYPDQRDKYFRALDSGERIKAGPKTTPYTNNIDPTQPNTGMGVNDIQHGRNLGYQNPDGSPWDSGYTLSQHGFMDGETRLMADRANKKGIAGATDWTPEQVQAASWIYEKARAVVNDPMFGGDMDKALAWANRTYGDYYPKHTLFATHEQIPGANTGHLTGITGAPENVRREFSEAAGWTNDLNRDALYQAAGAPNLEVRSGSGTFKSPGGALETNPLTVSRPVVGLKDGVMAPNSRAVAEAVERTRAVLGAQEASAAHRLAAGGKVADETSLFVPHTEGLSPDKARELAQIAEKFGFDVADTGQGFTLMNHRDIYGANADIAPESGVALKKLVTKELGDALRSAGFPVDGARTGKLDSVYEPSMLSEAKPGSGDATRGMLEKLDAAGPQVEAGIGDSPEVRQKVLQMMERDAQVSQAMGLPVREDLQRLRDIFARGGFKGVREALAAGAVLPAAAMMILRHEQQPEQQKAPGGL